MREPLKLDTDEIQDRILALEDALQHGTLTLEQVGAALVALSREMLFVAEDFESRRMNGIVPGANVTF